MSIESTNDRTAAVRAVLYTLFALSGFSGLIYESIWTHYLKLFLGHAAYAQTLVLAIFMGGMALGAWIAGQYSRRIPNPFIGYALVETILGVLGYVFDPGFRAIQAWAFDSVIPQLGSPGAVEVFKWTLSSVVILPQCMLLGATFPLMSAGLVRLHPAGTGRALGWLYFSNSLGGAVGVLVSGFVLVKSLGLPGAVLTAGMINIILGLLVWLVSRGYRSRPQPDTRNQAADAYPLVLLTAAFVTGAASFFYEIGWIRMLSLVLGAATQSFELMLSAFILGIALGGYWIRSRIDRLKDPMAFLGWVQIVMGGLALGTILIYGLTFEFMEAAMQAFERNATGYIGFNLVSHGICLLVMMPVTFCAGMTLPLITAMLIRSGYGERAIGRVYAANTLGAIIGVLGAVHFVMPVLGLQKVILSGALLDMILGCVLLTVAAGRFSEWARHAALASLTAVISVGVLVRFDENKMSAGVFRYGNTDLDGEVIYHRDGKTATVDVRRRPDETLVILTNGKPDASLSEKRTTYDAPTQTLLGGLPLVLVPDAKRAAVIGFGSGRSTHVLLHSPELQRVDTIEIEPAMVDGARLFGSMVEKAFNDPRSHVYTEDGRTFFSRHQRRYDIIVSEPSNPWVSGVSSLFSMEFYAQVRRYLTDGGILAQWMPLYEMDLDLAATVFAAVMKEFPRYAIYATNDGDVIIVAGGENAPLDVDGEKFARASAWITEMIHEIDVHTPEDLAIRRLVSGSSLASWLELEGVNANSDYFPILDQGAVRSRYLRANSGELVSLYPYSRRLENRPAPSPENVTYATDHVPSVRTQEAMRAAQYLAWRAGLRPVGPAKGIAPGIREDVLMLTMLDQDCDKRILSTVWLDSLKKVAARIGPFLSPGDAADFAESLRSMRCHTQAPEQAFHWIGFIEAVGTEDAARVRELGQELMTDDFWSEPALQVHFVLGEIILAAVLDNERAWLRKQADTWSGKLPRTLLLRYLLAAASRGT